MGGSDSGTELVYAYFSINLENGLWREIYGGDPTNSGRISGLDDGFQNGGQVTLWFSINTNN